MTQGAKPTHPSADECLAMYRNCASFNSRRAARKLTRFYDRYVGRAGVSAVQFPIIAALGSGRVRGLRELGRTLDLERSTLWRNIANLERAGLVETSGGAGPRPARIALTATGRETLARAHAAWLEAHRELARRLGENELHRAIDVLRRIERTDLDRQAK